MLFSTLSIHVQSRSVGLDARNNTQHDVASMPNVIFSERQTPRKMLTPEVSKYTPFLSGQDIIDVELHHTPGRRASHPTLLKTAR